MEFISLLQQLKFTQSFFFSAVNCSKGLCQANCHSFEKLNQPFFLSIEFQKVIYSLFLLFNTELKGIETRLCDNVSFGPTFSSLNAMPAKIIV